MRYFEFPSYNFIMMSPFLRKKGGKKDEEGKIQEGMGGEGE